MDGTFDWNYILWLVLNALTAYFGGKHGGSKGAGEK